MQFSFNNKSAIPQFLDGLTEENQENAIHRNAVNTKGSGQDLTGGAFSGKMVDLRKLPAAILQGDYTLVGAWKQQRIQTKPGFSHNKPYWMIRFRFRHKDHLAEYRNKLGIDAWEEFEKKRPMLLGELVSICSLAFWQVRAFRNPWFQDGNILPDVHCISLNFEGRQPLYEWDPPKSLGDNDLPAQYQTDLAFNIV